MSDIKTEYAGTVNPKLKLPDITISIGDSNMSTLQLNDVDFGILNTLIDNQMKFGKN